MQIAHKHAIPAKKTNSHGRVSLEIDEALSIGVACCVGDVQKAK
jgi:hypothetical protein